MRSAITIFLLLLMVSIQTPVGQLFKLPVLIEHFIKHKKSDSVSLVDFLQDHYSSQHNDADLPEDKQLPFKEITYYGIASAIVPGIINTNKPVTLPSHKKIIFTEVYTPQQHLGSIFHPPRV